MTKRVSLIGLSRISTRRSNSILRFRLIFFIAVKSTTRKTTPCGQSRTLTGPASSIRKTQGCMPTAASPTGWKASTIVPFRIWTRPSKSIRTASILMLHPLSLPIEALPMLRETSGIVQFRTTTRPSSSMNAAAYVARGVAYGTKGLVDRALHDFNSAIDLDPGNAIAYRDPQCYETAEGGREGGRCRCKYGKAAVARHSFTADGTWQIEGRPRR